MKKKIPLRQTPNLTVNPDLARNMNVVKDSSPIALPGYDPAVALVCVDDRGQQRQIRRTKNARRRPSDDDDDICVLGRDDRDGNNGTVRRRRRRRSVRFSTLKKYEKKTRPLRHDGKSNNI